MEGGFGSVLITGATGFLGSHLARRLVGEGAKVHVLAKPAAALSRIDDLLGQLTIWRGDLVDRDLVRECLRGCRPRLVFHLAGDTSTRRLDPDFRTMKLGVEPLEYTLHLLEELQHSDFPVDGVVRAGGLEEYGRGPYPYNESQREAPVSPYSAVQVAATHFCQMLQPVLRFPVVSLRLALVYGPGQAESFFIPSLISSFLRDEDFPMTGGEQGRDLLYVEDAMDAFLAAARTRGLGGRVINIGSGKEHSMVSVAECIRRLTGTRGKLLAGTLAPRRSEIEHLVCNNELARSLLGWQPRTSLEAGLAETVAWHRRVRPAAGVRGQKAYEPTAV